MSHPELPRRKDWEQNDKNRSDLVVGRYSGGGVQRPSVIAAMITIGNLSLFIQGIDCCAFPLPCFTLQLCLFRLAALYRPNLTRKSLRVAADRPTFWLSWKRKMKADFSAPCGSVSYKWPIGATGNRTSLIPYSLS